MSPKEYLSQARYLDCRIEAKKEQIQRLYDLATKCTMTWSDMPPGQPNGRSRMADCVIKMNELEDRMKKEMTALVNLKTEILDTISNVENIEYRTILEKRYLCYETWEKIADDLNYSVQHIHRLHGQALKKVKVPEKLDENFMNY